MPLTVLCCVIANSRSFQIWNVIFCVAEGSPRKPGSKFIRLSCMEAYGPYNSIRFYAWNHYLQIFHAIPRMESYDSIHGSAWNHMIPCMERYGTKSKNSKFSKFQIFVLLACHFPEITGKQLKTEKDTIKSENRSASKRLGIRTWVFSFCKLCLQFVTESDIFWCDIVFFSDLVPVVVSVILDVIYFSGSSCNFRCFFQCFRYFQMSLQWFPSFSIWSNLISCLQLYNSMRFHAWNHLIPCDSMHGNSMKLSYGTMHGIAWKTYEFGFGNNFCCLGRNKIWPKQWMGDHRVKSSLYKLQVHAINEWWPRTISRSPLSKTRISTNVLLTHNQITAYPVANNYQKDFFQKNTADVWNKTVQN